MATFKDRLIQALELREMSAAELSRLSGVNEGAISQYKKGIYKANQHALERLSKALNVSVPWLMGADVNIEPKPAINAIDKGITKHIALLLATHNTAQCELKIEIIKDIVELDFTEEQLKAFSAFLKSLK